MSAQDEFKKLFVPSARQPEATNVPTTHTVFDMVSAISKAQRAKDDAREAAIFAADAPGTTYIPNGVGGYTPIPQGTTKAAPSLTSPQRVEKATTTTRAYKQG